MKHRTQILLEDWQYDSLKEIARKMGTTLSSLLQEWVTEKIRVQALRDRKNLLQFAGSIRDKSDVAQKHDRYLGASSST